MSKVHVALIGCGGISRSHVVGYKNLDNVNVIATCDLVKERAIKRAEEIGIFQRTIPKVYTDFREMLESEPDIEAVDICTSHASHHEIAIASFDAGKHVLVEKPLGITVRACMRMIEAARKCGRILAVSEPARGGAAARAIHWAIKEGFIGNPRMLIWVDVEERLAQWGWRDFKLKAGGGWIFDGGVHYVNQWRYYLGEVEKVYGVMAKFEPVRYENFESQPPYAFFKKFEWPPGPKKIGPVRADVEDTIAATIKFENDVLVQWIYSCAAPGKLLRERVLYGSEGYIDMDNGILVSKKEKIRIRELVERYLSSLTNDENNNRKPELDGLQGLKDVAVPMAVYESAWLGEPVKIKDIENCKIENYQKEINKALNI